MYVEILAALEQIFSVDEGEEAIRLAKEQVGMNMHETEEKREHPPRVTQRLRKRRRTKTTENNAGRRGQGTSRATT